MDLSGIFKSLVWDNLIDAALVSASAALASVPVIGPILTWSPIWATICFCLKKFTDTIYVGAVLVIDFELIVLKNAAHQRALAEATLRLKGIAQTQGINSDAFKQAREADKKALSVFTHRQFGNAA